MRGKGRWCLWVLLAVAMPASRAHATETTVGVSATPSSYSWAFVGSTDLPLTRRFSSVLLEAFTRERDSLPCSCCTEEDFLGNGLPELNFENVFMQLVGFDLGTIPPCSVDNFPRCEPGVANIDLVTLDWTIVNDPLRPGARGTTFSCLRNPA